MTSDRSVAAGLLLELSERGPSTRALFYRDYVAPEFAVTIEDVDAAQRLVKRLVDAFVDPQPETWARIRSAAALLDAPTGAPSIAVVAAPPVSSPSSGPAFESSPWLAGRSERRPSPSPSRIEPVDLLAQTAAQGGGEARPTLPFAEPKATRAPTPSPAPSPTPPSAPTPRLTLPLYASYCAAREASSELAARFLEQHGVLDVAAEDAAWQRRMATDAAERQQFGELKRRYDAWWKKGGP